MPWYIKNFDANNRLCLDRLISKGIKKDSGSDIDIYIDGYIIPRSDTFNKYCMLNQQDLVLELYRELGDSFVDKIKGVFIIILQSGNSFKIFNDRHSLRKYFIYKESAKFFISDSLDLLLKNNTTSIDRENIALFSLLSHHIEGHTIYKNVFSCKPGMTLVYDGKKLNESYYWHPSLLARKKKCRKNPIREFSGIWKSVIENYIRYLNPGGISLTLTGGNDSRMTMAALLALNRDFHTFTYGNPHSFDGSIAESINSKLDIGHSNYFISNPTERWFHDQACDIIAKGNSLINIHRAHRNDAAASERMEWPDNDMLFTGLLGGEYLKEPRYGITIPLLFKQLTDTTDRRKINSLIKNELIKIGVITEYIDLDLLIDRLLGFIDHGRGFDHKGRKFIYTYLFYGCAHHSQDSNVFGGHFSYVINPFMDIDFLEYVSLDRRWYLNRLFSGFSRYFHSLLLVGITDYLAKELSDIPYAKKGAYTADDLLRHKVRYVMKRLSFFLNSNTDKYPSNFPMGLWLYEYCREQLETFKGELGDIFNLPYLKEQAELLKHKTTEQPWHLITNPVNIKLNYEYFGKK